MPSPRPPARGRSRSRSVFRCTECGQSSPRWAGRCPGCEAWNTLVEEIEAPAGPAGDVLAGSVTTDTPQPVGEVDVDAWAALPTGLSELDRVLGGGLVPGSVTLLGGEPGIGKSTVLLQALGGMAEQGTVLYVTAEESKQQVRLRAERLGTMHPNLLLVSETDVGAIVAHLDAVAPIAVVVDSIQTIFHPGLSSAPGSVAQVRETAAVLVREAKRRNLAVILVGHVTKEGSLAGPRVLEHTVDTVLTFEGDRHHSVRVLRAVKHRYSGTGELGLLEMTPKGLVAVDDPSGLFLADRRWGVPGSIVAPLVDGHRALLQEIQGLVVTTESKFPRRAADGVDSNRLALLLAVLARHGHIDTAGFEVYASAVGGVWIDDPGADVAVAMAIASSATQSPLQRDTVVFGEVGLGGELRQAQHPERRMAEAVRMGFRHAVVPRLTPDGPRGLRLIRVDCLADAITEGLRPPRAAAPTGEVVDLFPGAVEKLADLANRGDLAGLDAMGDGDPFGDPFGDLPTDHHPAGRGGR